MGMLDGKVALVTGGRGGIGRAICARFEREGATVFAADLSEGGSLAPPDGASRFVQLDVTSEDSVKAAMASVGERLDILVNAAGIEIEKTIEETSLEEWNQVPLCCCGAVWAFSYLPWRTVRTRIRLSHLLPVNLSS